MLTEVEKLVAARLPAEWIAARAAKPVIQQRLMRIRRIDHLADRFTPLAMMRLKDAIFDPKNRQLFSAEAGLQACSDTRWTVAKGYSFPRQRYH